MNMAYFENMLKKSGIWQIYKWQTLIQNPEEFYDEMMRRPMLQETADALKNIRNVREEIACKAQVTGKKEDYDRVIEIEEALYVCQWYVRQIADFIDEIRDRAFDKREKK